MYLSKASSLKLRELGFKRTYYVDEVAPFDCFMFNNEEWVVGGKIFPPGDLLSPADVYEQGVWLPSLSDLMIWLQDSGYTCTLECKAHGYGYKVLASDIGGNIIKGKSGVAEEAFSKVIEQILIAANR